MQKIDCVFKHLKRLEQEVKHWQMEHREAKAKGEWTYDLVRKKVDRLEQENEKLKDVTNEAIIEQEKLIKEINTLKQENRCLHESIDGAQIIINGYIELTGKYKSALEEIREIAEDVESASSIRFYRIKTKINEVINEQ